MSAEKNEAAEERTAGDRRQSTTAFNAGTGGLQRNAGMPGLRLFPQETTLDPKDEDITLDSEAGEDTTPDPEPEAEVTLEELGAGTGGLAADENAEPPPADRIMARAEEVEERLSDEPETERTSARLVAGGPPAMSADVDAARAVAVGAAATMADAAEQLGEEAVTADLNVSSAQDVAGAAVAVGGGFETAVGEEHEKANRDLTGQDAAELGGTGEAATAAEPQADGTAAEAGDRDEAATAAEPEVDGTAAEAGDRDEAATRSVVERASPLGAMAAALGTAVGSISTRQDVNETEPQTTVDADKSVEDRSDERAERTDGTESAESAERDVAEEAAEADESAGVDSVDVGSSPGMATADAEREDAAAVREVATEAAAAADPDVESEDLDAGGIARRTRRAATAGVAGLSDAAKAAVGVGLLARDDGERSEQRQAVAGADGAGDDPEGENTDRDGATEGVAVAGDDTGAPDDPVAEDEDAEAEEDKEEEAQAEEESGSKTELEAADWGWVRTASGGMKRFSTPRQILMAATSADDVAMWEGNRNETEKLVKNIIDDPYLRVERGDWDGRLYRNKEEIEERNAANGEPEPDADEAEKKDAVRETVEDAVDEVGTEPDAEDTIDGETLDLEQVADEEQTTPTEHRRDSMRDPAETAADNGQTDQKAYSWLGAEQRSDEEAQDQIKDVDAEKNGMVTGRSPESDSAHRGWMFFSRSSQNGRRVARSAGFGVPDPDEAAPGLLEVVRERKSSEDRIVDLLSEEDTNGPSEEDTDGPSPEVRRGLKDFGGGDFERLNDALDQRVEEMDLDRSSGESVNQGYVDGTGPEEAYAKAVPGTVPTTPGPDLDPEEKSRSGGVVPG